MYCRFGRISIFLIETSEYAYSANIQIGALIWIGLLIWIDTLIEKFRVGKMDPIFLLTPKS